MERGGELAEKSGLHKGVELLQVVAAAGVVQW